MSAVERKNQLVYDALEAKNTKQALQLCTKRIKKGEKGDYVHVRIFHPRADRVMGSQDFRRGRH